MKLRPPNARRAGFTLLELLVSTAVLVVLLSLLVGTLTQANDQLDRGSGRLKAMTAGRAALELIGEDIANAFQTNIVALCGSDAYAGNFDGTDTYGSTNSTIAFYRLPASMREGCYPIEYVEYIVSNRSDNVPVLLRRSFRFIDSAESASHEEQEWESKTDAPYPDDDPDFPETGLSALETSVEVLEGVAAVYFLPWAAMQDGFGELDDGVQPDAVDVYVELLPPSQCRRAAKIADDAKQSAFVARNSLRLARRFTIKSHPSFDIPPDLRPWWRMEDEDGGTGGSAEGDGG